MPEDIREILCRKCEKYNLGCDYHHCAALEYVLILYEKKEFFHELLKSCDELPKDLNNLRKTFRKLLLQQYHCLNEALRYARDEFLRRKNKS